MTDWLSLVPGELRDEVAEQLAAGIEEDGPSGALGSRDGSTDSLEQGAERLQAWRADDVERCRRHALQVALLQGEVHGDDFARVQLDQRNAIGVALNALAREGLVVSTGEHRPSRLKAAHGRRSYVYRLTGKGRAAAEALR